LVFKIELTRHLEASILRNGYPPTVNIEAFFYLYIENFYWT